VNNAQMSPPGRRAARVIVGTALVGASLLEVRRPSTAWWEEAVFRRANGAPDAWRVPVRVVMQAGTLGTVPVAAALAALTGRRGLALRLLAGGILAWFGAKAVKPMGGRQRPEQVVGTVRIREGIAGDLGWVSGHATVVTTMALVAADELPRRAGPILAGLVAATCFGRMYVGAHLPNDLLGGAGLGMIIAGLLPAIDGTDRTVVEPAFRATHRRPARTERCASS
jgi:membrane-associated phospholipid phosphatase